MSNVKKSVFAFVAVLTLAFIMGATMDGPDFGMSDGQASGESWSEMMKVAGDQEGGGHCC